MIILAYIEDRVIFPNPVSKKKIHHDVFAANPGLMLSAKNWTNLLKIKPAVTIGKSKRQLTSSMTTDELYALCPLNNVQDANVPAGCMAGIYNKFCVNVNDDYAECQTKYDAVIDASLFKPLGICAPWKKGYKTECGRAINDFNVVLQYATLNRTAAMNFVQTFFGSSGRYAPCVNTAKVKCIK